MSGLQSVESDAAQVSVLSVAGNFRFLGKVAFDLVGLGDGPPFLRVDSEEILLTLTDKRAHLACAAPGVTPVDSSEKGAPVRNGGYIWHDLGTEPSVCNRPVTESHGFGSSHRLGQCCLWFAALHVDRIEYAEVPLSLHLLLVVLCHIHLRDAFRALFPPCFGLILTFSYCLYDFLREQELGTGGSPITDRTACFLNRVNE